MPDDLAMSPADRFTSCREEDMSIGPGAHYAIDRLKALGVKLALVTKGAATRSTLCSSGLGLSTTPAIIRAWRQYASPEIEWRSRRDTSAAVVISKRRVTGGRSSS